MLIIWQYDTDKQRRGEVPACGKESEAIKDFDLRSVSLLKPEGVSGVWFIFRASYGGKPADKDGRAILQGDIELSPDEIGNWCFSYMGGWG